MGPDAGMGKIFAVVATFMFVYRLVQGIRTWRGNRMRKRLLAEAEAEKQAKLQQQK